MYQVLYRKYRPVTFDDVIGQPYIVRALKNQIITGQTGHAYLFTGVRGTGKTTCARIFAKAVNCLAPVDGEPCGKCANCLAIESGSAVDLCEIDAASNNGVDQIRELRDEVIYAPAELKYRIYIIDEAHMLTGPAFNALLKTLEEPPAHVKLILASTEVQKFPMTILSRCQRYDFRRIGAPAIAERLEKIAAAEKIPLDADAALLVAEAADGAMRDAISMLELCAGSGEAITPTLVRRTLGLASQRHVAELAEAFAAKNLKAATECFERVYAEGIDAQRLCTELLDFYRELLLAKIGARSGPCKNEESIDALTEKVSYEHISNCIDTLRDCYEKIRRSASPRLEVQLAIVRLCRASDVPTADLARRVAALEQRPAAPAAPAAQPAPRPAPTPAAPRRETPPAPAKTAESAPACAALPLPEWPDILDAVKAEDPTLFALLVNSEGYADGERLLIYSPTDYFREHLKKRENLLVIRTAVNRVLGADNPFKAIGLYKPAAGETPPTAQPTELEKLARTAKAAGAEVTVND